MGEVSGGNGSKSNGSSKIQYKKPKRTKTKLSGKERANDAPGWAKQYKPKINEDGKAFAKRILNEKYGKNGWDKKNPEFNQIKKWGDRSFE